MMNIIEWLNENAKQVPWDSGLGHESTIWVTKDRGDYLTRVGMEDKLSFLADIGLSQVQTTWETGKPCNIGFCEKEQKWYGWSHRAICGFGVGSKISKGDCAYVGATPEDMIEDRVAFFSDLGEEKAALVRAECQILPDRSGIRILHAPLKIPMAESIEDALDPDAKTEMVDIYQGKFSVEKCGRGEWEAKTLDDAKQMAMDFAEDVA